MTWKILYNFNERKIIMKNCNIIKDLLPSYIEKLTSIETSTFIEKHLEECNECKNIFNNMNQDDKDNIEYDEDILNSKDVKFFKNMNKRILRRAEFLGTSIGILLLIIIYISIVIYRFTIIENLLKKQEDFTQATNIFLEVNDNYIGENLQFIENLKTKYWYKDNIIKIQQTSSKYGLYNSFTRYIDLEKKLIYVFNHTDKTVEIINRKDILENNEIFEIINKNTKALNNKIKLSMDIHVPIYSKNDYSIITDWNVGSYIYDSKTGLLNMSYYYEYTGDDNNSYNHHFQTYTYSNNSVSDDDIIIPNVDEYTIIQKE